MLIEVNKNKLFFSYHLV